MSQLETLQDIYSKIADIYDKFCNLSSDIESSILYNVVVLDNDWSAPSIELDNPDGLIEILEVESNINQAIQLTFDVSQSLETEYLQVFGDPNLVPVPKGGAIVWLPKLIAILIGYKAPIKFLASIIIDFLKEILLEEIKKRVNRKKQYLYGDIILNASASFAIPYDAESLVITSDNIPNWYGKRFDSIANGDYEKYYTLIGTFNLGFKPEASTNIFWNNDYKIEYKRQWYTLTDSEDINKRYATVYLNNQITAIVQFVRSL